MNHKTRDTGLRSDIKAGKNYILAIAIDEYQYTRNLKNAVSDVVELIKTKGKD